MNEKLQVYDTKMQKTLHSLDAELATIRAGRANPHILDMVQQHRFSRWQISLFQRLV